MNSYGYSPHPFSQYLIWVEEILQGPASSSKPIIISITTSKPHELQIMIDAIQQLRQKISDAQGSTSRIGIELNTSCPNITGAPPPAYKPESLAPLLEVLAWEYQADNSLTIGLKLPPYVYATQFTDVLDVISKLTRDGGETTGLLNPIAFLSCTNTLGTSLLFSDQVTPSQEGSVKQGGSGSFALPTPLGGLAGEALHALALGNVYTFSQLLEKSPDPSLRRIVIVGIGGVTSPAAVRRMRDAGAKLVACATLLGRDGIGAFRKLSLEHEL